MKTDELFQLINFCRTIQKESTDPFDLNVKRYLGTLKQYLKKWKSLDDLLIDAEAISELAKIIELQGKWIRDRSSSFYIDPVLMELKLKLLDSAQLANAFFKSWHPIISLDRITPKRLKEGLDYWNAFCKRKEDFPLPSTPETFTFGIEDLIDLNILSMTEFEDLLREVSKELGARGRIEYHEFIYEDKFEDSIKKAYLTSFLVSEGKAELDINPLEEKVFISPRNANGKANTGDAKSIPISLSYEDWLRWKRNQRQRQKRN